MEDELKNIHLGEIQNKFYLPKDAIHLWFSSVRSPAPNGRYRVPAPSALTKLFSFCADRRPATLPALPIESPRRRRPPHSTTNNNLLFQRALALAFPFRERQTRTDLGPPALEGAPRRYQVSPAYPPSLPYSILRTPFARSIADLARIRSC
ncbi:hypothetical protein EVAR_43933_1 [Eumeta japonica]|uniref:Uncharacterized protein n=1 Tax=Eumeta variegata TaxID=151549 RepID=A0A4C1WQE1_EUMVA|nr:hypothetical protein EVAR_43933_1 [Eumeta japonica]